MLTQSLHTSKSQEKWYWCIILFISSMAWLMQNHFYIGSDVSWLITATNRLLQGGSYSKNIFDPNPPLILYLYMPCLFIAKIFSLNMVLSLRVYLFLLGYLSFLICYFLAKKIFSPLHLFMRHLFLLSLFAIFFILPGDQLGQRDHLMVIFALPYILALVCRLQNKTLNSLQAIVIGIFASVGFALKPYFLITPLFLELYYISHYQKWSSWLRIETVVMLSLFMIYPVLVYIFYPDYIHVIVPLATKYLYQGLSFSLKSRFFNPIAIFCYIVVYYSVFEYKNIPYKLLNIVLCITLISFLFAYFLQQTNWYHHILPACSIAILLATLLFSSFLLQARNQHINFASIALGSIILCVFLCYNSLTFFKLTLTLSPIDLFAFIGILSIVCLYTATQDIFKAIIGTCVVVIPPLFYSTIYLNAEIKSNSYLFIILSMSILLFRLRLPNYLPHKNNYVSLFLFGLFLFAFPWQLIHEIYLDGVGFKKAIMSSSITHYMKSQHESVYFLSNNFFFPHVIYANVRYVPRFPYLWTISAMRKKAALCKNNLCQNLEKDKNSIIDMISEDLNTQKANLVFVQVDQDHFNYANYCLTNKNFQLAWEKYHLVTTMEDGTLTFNVYQRSTT